MTTYYIKTTGNDGLSGLTIADAWLTFAHAVSVLVAGDTLIVRDGTYNASNSGFFSAVSKNGTLGSPITIIAENERQAFIQGDGSVLPFSLSNCSYWVVEGLRLCSADFNGASNGDPLTLSTVSNSIFRRLLISHNNRYKNSHLIQANTVSDNLFEEIELYYFHRHGISLSVGSDNNVVRRCYANSRLYADIGGGYVSGNTSKGDEAYATYPGSNNIVENCISENNDAAYTINASGLSQNNKILGSISLNDVIGVRLQARGATLATMPQDTTIENVAVLNASSVPIYIRSSKNTNVNNVTILGGGTSGGLIADATPAEPGDGSPTTFSANTLVSSTAGTGFNFVSQSSFLINYPDSFNNGTAFNPAASNPSITNELTIDPVLGSAKIFIPAASPLKGAGLAGADIGANIIYRYQDGVLTATPLWSSGIFPHGVIITGLNDIVGNSAFDVHTRLGLIPASSLPTASTQVCVVVSYALGFAHPNNTPNIGVFAKVSLADSTTAGIKMRVERCTGAGCAGFVHIGDSSGVQYAGTANAQAEFLDSGVYGTIYRYRIRLENNSGASAYSAIITIDTTTEGASSCDTGVITDFADEDRVTAVREIYEQTTDVVMLSGHRTIDEWSRDELRITGLRTLDEYIRDEVRVTGLRIIYEFITSTLTDLRVTKTVSNSAPLVGENVVWTILVENISTVDATNVILSDLLPPGLLYVNHIATAGSYNPVSGIWFIGSLPAGDSETLSIESTVLIGGTITNIATATSNEPDGNPGDNTDSASVNPERPICPDIPIPMIFAEDDADLEHKTNTCTDEV